MNSGKYVFAQLLQYINRYEFDKFVSTYDGDFRTRDLNCWNQFIQLFWPTHFTKFTSRYLHMPKAHRNKLYHLGIKQSVNQSSLSMANERRDYRILQTLVTT